MIIGARAALLQRDSDVVDLDGFSDLAFPECSRIVCMWWSDTGRILCNVSKVAYQQLVDFTDPDMPVFDFGTSLNNGNDYTGLSMNDGVINGYRALWAGDFNGDGKIKFTNPNDDLNYLFSTFSSIQRTICNANFNYAYGYYSGDVNMNGKAKFDNPNDDKTCCMLKSYSTCSTLISCRITMISSSKYPYRSIGIFQISLQCIYKLSIAIQKLQLK